MDSRDIVQEPVIEGNLLDQIYDMQKELLVEYIKMEGLPPYPFNVNKKENQQILKDFTARIIEELSEGYESTELAAEITRLNQLWFGGEIDKNAYQLTLSHLQNTSEEMADALHFFMELLIYINVETEDLVQFLKVKKNINHTGDNILQTLMDVGYEQYIYNLYISEGLQYVHPSNSVDVLAPLKDMDSSSINIKLHELGSKINYRGLLLHKYILWDITHWLNISRNFLKNKPWKQSEVMTAEIQYQEAVVRGFLNFLGYLKFMGGDEELVYYLYFKKNMVNQFRIKSKY